MAEITTPGIIWEAPEHIHAPKGSDWYWAVGIIAIAAAAASILFGNTLFGVVILLGASTVIIFSNRTPKIMEFAVSARGIRIGKELYPYPNLEAYYIDEENPAGPQLIIKPNGVLATLLIIDIPAEFIGDIEDIVGARLPEEHMEEPLSHKVLEYFGF